MASGYCNVAIIIPSPVLKTGAHRFFSTCTLVVITHFIFECRFLGYIDLRLCIIEQLYTFKIKVISERLRLGYEKLDRKMINVN